MLGGIRNPRGMVIFLLALLVSCYLGTFCIMWLGTAQNLKNLNRVGQLNADQLIANLIYTGTTSFCCVGIYIPFLVLPLVFLLKRRK